MSDQTAIYLSPDIQNDLINFLSANSVEDNN